MHSDVFCSSKQLGFGVKGKIVFRLSFLVLMAFALVSQIQVRGDIWIAGHGDIGVGLESNRLHLHMHFENPVTGANGVIAAGEYESDDHVIGVPNPPIARPTGAQWNFLGSATNVWFLPVNADPAKPYLGFGLEELVNTAANPIAGNWNGNLTWALDSVVSSPVGSNFSMWTEVLGNPNVNVATSDGITIADSFTQAAGGHEHFNLGFTREGTYELRFRISGVHATLGALSDNAVYTFQVGTITAIPEPSSIALISGCLAVAVFVRSRKSKAIRNSIA
jgi:surface-anchored protein